MKSSKTIRQNARAFTALCVFFASHAAVSQDILPPHNPWSGKSLSLITTPNNPWITPAESSDFKTTPSYKETMSWLSKLCQASGFRMVPIGRSDEGRDINMVIASHDKNTDSTALANSVKPLLLIQAGIHAGEIDGKDAGMMLLRDLAFGNKKALLDKVNVLFIPILNVDGHERSSENNRVNQRGPDKMGWRTNGRNLNLNRDYAKIDTKEIRSVIKVINAYHPDLYVDVHVTDGADYQYDITYGFVDDLPYSPHVATWLSNVLVPYVNKQLTENGHVPGPLLFPSNNRDFESGNMDAYFSARYSTAYGDVRHLPSILEENHSLKPYNERVLGTYVFLQGIIQLLGQKGNELNKNIDQDRLLRPDSLNLARGKSTVTDSMNFLGIKPNFATSTVTGKERIQWTGEPIQSEIPVIHYAQPDRVVKVPKVYWVPSTYPDVIRRLQLHGIVMDIIKTQIEKEVYMYRIADYKFGSVPYEGHLMAEVSGTKELRKEIFYPGSARISTDQDLGELVVLLLEPQSDESFIRWGFFNEIFDQTEYIEEYVMDTLASRMLAGDEKLRAAFEKKKHDDPAFANDPGQIYRWFYAQTPYFDRRWLLYPVGIEY